MQIVLANFVHVFSSSRASVAQWIERRFPKPQVACSIHAGGANRNMAFAVNTLKGIPKSEHLENITLWVAMKLILALERSDQGVGRLTVTRFQMCRVATSFISTPATLAKRCMSVMAAQHNGR